MKTDLYNVVLKAAVVGCGRIGAFTSDKLRKKLPHGWIPLSHAEAIDTTLGLELAALCDINEKSLQRAQKYYQLNSSQCFSDYRQMIRAVRPDVLSVATRTKGRCEIIQFAIRNGIRGIHIEKPISYSIKECRQVLTEIQANEVAISYGTTRRYMEIYRKASCFAWSGKIGEVKHISIRHGRTNLMWNHPHSLDLLLFFSRSEDFEYVQANCEFANEFQQGYLVDDDPIIDFAFVKFKNGITGSIIPANGMNATIHCSRGEVTVWADGHSLTWTDESTSLPFQSDRHFKQEPVFTSGTQNAFIELYAHLIGRSQKLITSNEILANQSLLTGIFQSSRNAGKKVYFNDVDENIVVTGAQGKLHA